MWAQLHQKIAACLTSDSLVLALVLMQLLSDSISLVPPPHTLLYSTRMLSPQELPLALGFALNICITLFLQCWSAVLFSVPLQQLHAEPGSPERWTHAGLEIQHCSSAADCVVTTGKRNIPCCVTCSKLVWQSSRSTEAFWGWSLNDSSK